MGNTSLLLVRILFASFVLAACTSNATPPASPVPPVDQENIRVNELSSSQETVAEVIYINNCGNPASAEQVSEHSQTISVEVGAELGVSVKVVEGSVEGKYISSKGVTKSQRVTAAPYTNMKFTLLWTEKVNEGTVTIEGKTGQATYRVSVPISVQQVSAENLGCLETSPPTLTTPQIAAVSPTMPPQSDIECNTVNLQPEENAKIRRGQDFKIKFLLINSGKTVWPENLELVLASNPGSTLDPSIRPIKVPRVQPGDSITVGPLDARAPNTVGHYVVSFKLGNGLCWPYVAFEVVK